MQDSLIYMLKNPANCHLELEYLQDPEQLFLQVPVHS